MANLKIYLLLILASLLLIGAALVTSRYLREIGAARQAVDRLGSQVIDTACGPVEYASVGNGDPVLVVHGAFGGFDQGLVMAKPLITAGYRVISVSRFGYLRTPMPKDASVDKQADSFACLLDALGISKVAVLTASGGAVSSIRFAVRHLERVSALILQSPSAPGDVPVAPPPKAALALMRSDFVYWAMVTYLRPSMQRMIGVPAGFAVTPAEAVQVSAILATTLPSSARIDGFTFDNYGVTAEFQAEISDSSPYSAGHIQAPVLVINAQDDPLAVPANVRGLAEKIPNVRLHIVSDGGHLLLGHSDEVNAEMLKFLNSHRALADSR